ncbi:DUF885 domain-containing protein [Rhizosaccharibacter radicis]|uniref:DUF885 family protein n=1 Tax=Rhizosaccharibacter radicis TaxID=2782605 RepID=A0ABT1W1X8_9PROT|nr:DUF885 family protein [Acetobacteraceae bacterium KSS12]
MAGVALGVPFSGAMAADQPAPMGTSAPVAAAGAKPADDPVQTLRTIIADYDRYSAAIDPITAGQRGNQAARRVWPDDSPGAVRQRQEQLRALKAQLDAVPAGALSGEDALNRTLLEWRLELDLDGFRFDEERIPFTADEGFFQVPSYAAEGTTIRTDADAADWIERLRQLPTYYDIEIANMRRGLHTGFTQPRLIAEKIEKVVQAQAALPAEKSPLLAPLDQLPSIMPPDQRQKLREQALEAIRTAVKPAEQKLAAFFRDEYVPGSRTTLGAADMPDGRAYYAYRVRHETTTDLTPDQVFALGQSEIARIRQAMDQEIHASGFHGDFKAFQHFLRTDKRFYVTTREALMEKASRLAKRVDGQLPHFIGKLPRLSYGVREVPRDIEENYTSGRYNPGSPEQGIAGGLMINTSHLDQRPLYELPALVSHEGAPGHHIQIALAQEMTGLPAFRRDSDITAYVEGWALYSEQLTREFGLYGTPYERFGLLSMEMWRACRLVMDVGIHWKGWSRDQALSCLRDNTALADKNMQNETDRYIAWPGQALGYKIGELRLEALRKKAEAALGARFDIRRFHDVLLDEGAMPLSVVEQRVDDWIAAGGGAATPAGGH